MKSREFSNRIDHEHLENIFQVKFDADLREFINGLSLYYRELNKSERDEHILKYLQFLYGDIESAGPQRKPVWAAGWAENLEGFVRSGLDLTELTPHYYRRDNAIMRINGEFVEPQDVSFEAKFLAIVHKIISKFYLSSYDVIYELGSGPLHNIVGFAGELKGKKFIATDWVTPPKEIAEIIETNKLLLGFQSHEFAGAVFDFNEPSGLVLSEESIVMTFGSMEQLGENFGNLLAFFMSQPAREFLHIEPIIELYDRSKLFDDLAYRYSIKRNYLSGFYPALHRLQVEKKVKILEERKILGSGFHDGWTLIRWRKEY